mmetsp:Transcript_992/g.2548  ORF Transcript_992/g.2548 Transcript_992/m.2548 type:complete len:195 (-) Transcript_992:431-1015(-)
MRYCPMNLTASYFTQAARFREQYGVNRIFLATDNKEAAALCDAGVLGFECRHIGMDRSKFESATFIEKRVEQHEEGALSGSTVALDALADIDMLADCDFLIVLLRSAVSRLALSLALGRKGKLPPFMSLQWPWSPNYHKRKFKAGKGAKMGKVPMKLGKLPMKVGRRVPPSGAKYRNRQDWLRDVVTQQKGAAA